MSVNDKFSKEAIEHGTIRGFPRRIVRKSLLGLFFLMFKLRIKQVERVPKDVGVLIVANHIHNADPILLAVAHPEPIHFMCKKEAYDKLPFTWLLRWVGAFPVDRGMADRFAIKRAIAALVNGIDVGMFPEGTRSPVFALQSAHPGAGMIALAAHSIVQPVAITGTERMPMNGSKGKATGDLAKDPGHEGAQILYGEPFRIARELNGKRVTADMATDLMMVEIARILPEPYRGVYADKANDESTRLARLPV